jgi:DNA-binding Lrp family transcriptional regulator
VARSLAKNKEVESVDILAGDWELVMKIRTKDQDEYYNFLKTVISKEQGIENTNSIIALKEIKSEFILT